MFSVEFSNFFAKSPNSKNEETGRKSKSPKIECTESQKYESRRFFFTITSPKPRFPITSWITSLFLFVSSKTTKILFPILRLSPRNHKNLKKICQNRNRKNKSQKNIYKRSRKLFTKKRRRK